MTVVVQCDSSEITIRAMNELQLQFCSTSGHKANVFTLTVFECLAAITARNVSVSVAKS